MPPIDAWLTYPEGLGIQKDHSHIHNHSAYNQQLKDDAKRLFLADGDQISVKAIKFTDNEVNGRFLNRLNKREILMPTTDLIVISDSDFENFLNSSTGPATRILFISQQSSWGQLTISESCMRKLLAKFESFPVVIDVIRAFGQRTTFKDESFARIRFQDAVDKSLREMTYLVKHVEEHGREEISEKWSIRQTGVYHRSCKVYGETFLVLNPSRSLQTRIKEFVTAKKNPAAQDVHAAILSASMENWRWYTSDLEHRYLYMKTRAQLSRVDDLGLEVLTNLDGLRFEDIQDIQVLEDKLRVLDHAVEMDLQILSQVRLRLGKTTSEGVDGLDSTFDDLISIAMSEKARISSLTKRLDGTLTLIKSILDFRCLASLEHNSRVMTELTRLSQAENALIIDLTKKSARDTDILKTLTLVALIYLPATFTSSMMGMDYISVSSLDSRISLDFKGEFWIFLFVTAMLLIATVGGYYCWLHFHKISWCKDSFLQIGNTPVP